MRLIIDGQRERASNILTDLKGALLEGARALLEQEVITGEELKTLLGRHGIPAASSHDDSAQPEGPGTPASRAIPPSSE